MWKYYFVRVKLKYTTRLVTRTNDFLYNVKFIFIIIWIIKKLIIIILYKIPEKWWTIPVMVKV